MKVIGVGHGRTGTLSLKHALEELGFGPCYHMTEVMLNGSHVPKWIEAYENSAQPWDEIFEKYEATVDVPGALFYKEFLDYYPDAKFVLTTRDPEKW